MYKTLKLIILSVVILIIICSSFFFTVNEGEYVIVTQFGKPLAPRITPGLKLKLPPPIHRVVRFDARQQLFVSRRVEFLTKDKKNILIKCYVTYKINDPLTFYQAVGDAVTAQQKLDDLVIAKGGAAVGDFNFSDLISNTQEIKIGELENRIKKDIKIVSEKDYGISISNVGISRLSLPETNAQSVYNRMRAERRAMADKYRAEGQQEAAKIRADADRQKRDIESTASKEAEIFMGEGDAEAARIYADAFSKDPEFYKFWRTLIAYESILDNQTTLVLTDDSELFQYLDR